MPKAKKVHTSIKLQSNVTNKGRPEDDLEIAAQKTWLNFSL